VFIFFYYEQQIKRELKAIHTGMPHGTARVPYLRSYGQFTKGKKSMALGKMSPGIFTQDSAREEG
jgi:hypothetical protein